MADKVSAGKNAASATPICAFAAATLRSADAMSGRRSSSCDGKPGGTTGNVQFGVVRAMVSSEGGLPTSSAIACSSCARCTCASSACACAALSCACACTTSLRLTVPALYWFWVSVSDLSYAATASSSSAISASATRSSQ